MDYRYDPRAGERVRHRDFRTAIRGIFHNWNIKLNQLGDWIRAIDWDEKTEVSLSQSIHQSILQDMRDNEIRSLIEAMMHITPDLETYFLSFLLTQNARSDVPTDTMARRMLQVEVGTKMKQWDHAPDCLKRLKRAYQEAGVSNDAWFYEQLGDAYLRWLSKQ